MPRMTIGSAISEDRQSAIIQLNQDGEPLGHIIVDAAALDGFIRELAKCRASLAEEVVPSLDPGARLELLEVDPAWLVDRKTTDPNNLVLALRHRGLGWCAFRLELDRALAISQALSVVK